MEPKHPLAPLVSPYFRIFSAQPLIPEYFGAVLAANSMIPKGREWGVSVGTYSLLTYTLPILESVQRPARMLGNHRICILHERA